jgi:hypothetical protein
MRTSSRTILMIFFSLLCTGAAFAQKANFSGTWNIDTTKIDFGGAPHWVLPVKFQVVQSGEKENITRTIASQDGKESSRTLDLVPGTTTEYTTDAGDKGKCLMNWNADQPGFTITVQSVKADGSPGQSYEETWSLADGGKTLVINRSVEQANGMKYSIKAIYDRQ